MIIISQYLSTLLNAGPKAKLDIEKILKQEFKGKVHTLKLTGKEEKQQLSKLIYKITKAIISIIYIRGNDLVLIQAPFTNNIRFTKQAKNKIAFIHDIEGIRKQDNNIEKKEINFFSSCRFIIVHNNKMKEYLVNSGIDINKIYVLELFDYLTDNEIFFKDSISLNETNPQIIYTGNLDKANFLKQLDSENMNFILNIYGTYNNDLINEKIVYKGKFSPDKLINNLHGDLGLVWDGDIDDKDEFTGYKNYTKFNNPHKLSCYLAAGIPVIVWGKSAISNFVVENNVGYVINNLYDINNINFSDYKEKKNNAEKISEKLRNGYFTKKVVYEILDDFKKGNS